MKLNILAFSTILGVSFCSSAFADFKWDIDGGVVTGYDDNVTYANTNKIGDMVTRTSLGGGFSQENSNDAFNFDTGVTENIYTNHSTLDNLAENLNTDYKGDLSPYEHLKATEVFTHSVDPSSLQNAFGRINGSYGTYYNKFDLESTTDITEKWSGTVKYIQSNYIYSVQALSDTTLYNPGISTKYDFNSQSQGMINYDYRIRTFSPGKTSNANTPSLGWRQYLNPQWYIDLLSGVDFIQGFGKNLVEPRYGAGLTHDVDQNTELTLMYDKQYESDQYTQDINNDWHVTLNAFHEFTSRFNADISLYTGQGRYVVTGISEKYVGTTITAKYAITNHIDFSLTYTFQDSISNSTIRANTQNTIFAGLKFKY